MGMPPPAAEGAWLLHVRYVSEPTEGPSVGTLELLRDAILAPSMALVAASLAVLLIAYIVVMPRLRGWGAFRATLAATLLDYHRYIPWILRLAAGIALMGAGLDGYLFAAHLDTPARGAASILLLAAGFGLLVGAAVRVFAAIGILLFLYALLIHGLDVFMAAEVLAALIAVAALGAGRPSVDDLLAKTLPAAPRTVRPAGRLRAVLGPAADADVSVALSTWVPVLLRVGLGLALAYAGLVEKLLDPGPAIATAERYHLAVGFLTPQRWVVLAALLEIVLGLALILGAGVRPVAALAFLVLTLTLFALPDDPVVAHVALWGGASAVFIFGAGPSSLDRWRLRRAEREEM